MPRLIWSPRALRDVARLHAFLASRNRAAAKRAVATIRQSVRLLGEHPEAGRPVQDMPVEIREWPINFGAGGYVVVYRHETSGLVVLSVRHSREGGET